MNIYKQYIDAVEAYYPLMNDYGDSSVVFYKTKYVTNQKPFIPKIQGNNYPALKDCLARDIHSGKILSVFRNVNIDKSKYRLLREEVPENAEALDWYEVTEVWGYTPDNTIKSTVITAWTTPEFKPDIITGYAKTITSSVINDDNTATLACDNSDGRAMAGNTISLSSSEYTIEGDGGSGGGTFIQKADNVIIERADEESFTVRPFEWTIYDLSGVSVGSVQSFNEGSAFNKGVNIDAVIMGSTREMSLNNTDEYNRIHIVNVDNSDRAFKDGDIIKLGKEYWQDSLLWYYKQVSDPVKIYKATSTSIMIPFFYWNVYQENNIVRIESNNQSGGFYTPGDKYITQYGEARASWAGDFAGIQIVDFVTDLNPNNAWAPKTGKQVVTFLSYFTTPTLKEYLLMIANGDMVLAQPQMYETFMGNIYKRTSVYIKCQ